MPQIAGLTLTERSPLLPKSELERQQDWERGIIDYTGADR